jgi:hypothetical protein
MASVISDEISEKADCVLTKTFDVAVGRDGSAQDYAESFWLCSIALRARRAATWARSS